MFWPNTVVAHNRNVNAASGACFLAIGMPPSLETRYVRAPSFHPFGPGRNLVDSNRFARLYL